MRSLLIAACAVAALVIFGRPAAAQPVKFALKGDVAVGSKPQLQITAIEPLADIRIALERDDGKHFAMRHGSLAKGRSVTLPIGDGAPGRASYKGTLTAKVAGKTWTEELTFDTLVRAPLRISYDADHLDLDRRVLQFKASRPAASATLTVIGEDGKELGKGSASYSGKPADTWLAISWTQPANTRVMKMQLRVATADGTATNVELIPWSVTIEHEDVNFATDSATIEPSETKKLDASVAKIADVVKRTERFMKLRLYIAGHTDTVGSHAKNRKLSLDRALAIGRYFKRRGITIPISVAGFGEEVLAVQTGDNTDERANRRVDYVIGPDGGAPPFKGPYLRAKATWKQLR